jgi:SAM-dependent methyltransferase
VLVEPAVSGAVNARRRGIRDIICAAADDTSFRPRSLGAVGLFDVIEHIDDDRHFLASIRALMKPGGWLYASVPAYPLLWSGEDVAAGHFRRYRLDGFLDLLAAAGFETDFATYIFRFLPLPILLLRALPYRIGLGTAPDMARDHGGNDGRLSHVFARLLRGEVDNIRNGVAMKFGGSCLVAARVRDDVAAD